MDNPTAIEKARELCRFHTLGSPCPHCNKIAAALKRAYADGMEAGRKWSRVVATTNYDPVLIARKEADQLEVK